MPRLDFIMQTTKLAIFHAHSHNPLLLSSSFLFFSSFFIWKETGQKKVEKRKQPE